MIQIKKCLYSFEFAFKGIRSCFRTENNFRIHTFVALGMILLGAWAKLARWEWCVLLLTIGLVLVCELINTSMEKLTDLVSPDFHPQAGAVKDLAAGAVLIASAIAIGIGCFLFFPFLMAIKL